MLVAGLTGGLGSGKSTVASGLERRGVTVIDTDVLARRAVEPGTMGLEAIVARFGRQYLNPDGTLDRHALAELVFHDEDSLADLNGIVHPFVRDEVRKWLAREEAIEGDERGKDGKIILIVVPLLVESGQYKTDVVITVDCDEATAVRRVVAERGWTETEAWNRIATQATRERRRAAADLVIDNSGSSDQLEEQIEHAWQWLKSRTP